MKTKYISIQFFQIVVICSGMLFGKEQGVAQVAMPTIIPDGRKDEALIFPVTYFDSTIVTISCATEGATLYYNVTNGYSNAPVPADPTINSTKYDGPFVLGLLDRWGNGSGYAIKAIAVKDGLRNSDIASAAFLVYGSYFGIEGGCTSTTRTDTSENIFRVQDFNLNTCWEAFGDGQWFAMWIGYVGFPRPQMGGIGIAFCDGDRNKAYFEIQLADSLDFPQYPWTIDEWCGTETNCSDKWETVLRDTASGATRQIQDFWFTPDPKASYIRIVGHGNSSDMNNGFSEILPRVADYRQTAVHEHRKIGFSPANEIAKPHVSVSANRITIRLDATGKWTALLVNAQGRKAYEETASGGVLCIERNAIPSGLYMLQLFDPMGRQLAAGSIMIGLK